MEMSLTARADARRPTHPTRTSFAEGAVILVVLYALLGAGIGAACGSFVLGMAGGLLVGAFAAGAILLIRGAAQGAKSA
jgi:hypothetical protein